MVLNFNIKNMKMKQLLSASLVLLGLACQKKSEDTKPKIVLGQIALSFHRATAAVVEGILEKHGYTLWKSLMNHT
jgi:ABC-type proline/glycine betaine transport system substrate-binding protein